VKTIDNLSLVLGKFLRKLTKNNRNTTFYKNPQILEKHIAQLTVGVWIS